MKYFVSMEDILVKIKDISLLDFEKTNAMNN